MDNRALENKINELEEEVHRLRDELNNKRDAVARAVFQRVTDLYGVHPYRKKKIRDSVIHVFHYIHSNWDRF